MPNNRASQLVDFVIDTEVLYNRYAIESDVWKKLDAYFEPKLKKEIIIDKEEAISDIKRVALELCMETKIRYMEALNITVFFAHKRGLTAMTGKLYNAAQKSAYGEFFTGFKKEYAEYDSKMRAAGMK